MQIKANIKQKLKVETYSTTSGEKKKQTIIVETTDQYPKKIAVQIDPSKVNIENLTYVNISINIESKEYNGKWYTNIYGWKVEAVEPPKVEEVEDNEIIDDIPF